MLLPQPAKADKKVVKRSADGDESTHAPKQEVFVVTPSKNMQEYLDIVKLNNAAGSEEYSAVVTEALKEPTTIAAPSLTLSSNPFQAPNTESNIHVAVKVDEPTASVVKVISDLVHIDVTAAPVQYGSFDTLPPTTSTTPPPPPSLAYTEATTQVPTTQSVISETPSTTTSQEATTTTQELTTTTQESTTTVTTTTAKKEDSSEESKESGEEEDENKVCSIDSLKTRDF